MNYNFLPFSLSQSGVDILSWFNPVTLRDGVLLESLYLFSSIPWQFSENDSEFLYMLHYFSTHVHNVFDKIVELPPLEKYATKHFIYMVSLFKNLNISEKDDIYKYINVWNLNLKLLKWLLNFPNHWTNFSSYVEGIQYINIENKIKKILIVIFKYFLFIYLNRA